MKLTQKQWYLVAAGAVLVIGALVALAVALRGGGTPLADEPGEATGTVESSWTVEATGTADSEIETQAPDPDAPPIQTPPSYARYARILAVGGVPGNYTVEADFFDVYTGDAAVAYAKEHGLTVPANGILSVNEEAVTESIPLKSNVTIVYKAGGVDALVQLNATVEQLRDWASGSASALDGALTDVWEITVEQGVATRIEMVAIAD